MYWFTSKNKYIDKILMWIEDNILDRIFYKRIYNKIRIAMESAWVEAVDIFIKEKNK